jgi:hypothetical protein
MRRLTICVRTVCSTEGGHAPEIKESKPLNAVIPQCGEDRQRTQYDSISAAATPSRSAMIAIVRPLGFGDLFSSIRSIVLASRTEWGAGSL